MNESSFRIRFLQQSKGKETTGTTMLNSRAKEEKHKRILSAATKVFARKGFFHSRVSEIAEEAGVADGTIYLYFKNKDDILISLFEEKMQLIVDNCKESSKNEISPDERLRKLISTHFELMQQDSELAEVVTVELRQSAKFMREYTPKLFLAYLKLYENAILEGQEKGIFRKDVNARTIARAIFGAMDELSLSWALSRNRSAELSKASVQIVTMVIQGIKNNS